MSVVLTLFFRFFFFFNDTATTEIYTLSLHDALPIRERARLPRAVLLLPRAHQPRDDARREARCLVAEQRRQAVAEVARREPAQVQRRQELGDRLRLAQVRREDLACELLPLAPDHTLIVDPRSLDGERARCPWPKLDLT